jgi:hypothetical protein
MFMTYFGFKKLSLRFFTLGHLLLILLIFVSSQTGKLFDSYVMQVSITWYLLFAKLLVFALYTAVFVYTVNALKFISFSEIKGLLRIRHKA